jgi:hypothetical protein
MIGLRKIMSEPFIRLSKFAKLGKSLQILSELGFVGFKDDSIKKNNV